MICGVGLAAGFSARSLCCRDIPDMLRSSGARSTVSDAPYAYMGGCQNYGPVWVPIIIRHLLTYYLRYPKRDPNFDNHPHELGLVL